MFAPLPIGFMFRYPFIEFIFVYKHNVGQILSRELYNGIVSNFNIVKDL